MKPIHKGVLGVLVLSAAGLTALSAAALRNTVSPPEGKTGTLQEAPAKSASPAVTAPAVVPASQGAPGTTPSAGDGAPCIFGDRAATVPQDLHASVKTTPRGRILTVERRGHLVTLRRGHERRVAMSKLEWTEAAGTGPLVWETTDPKTLETLRGDLALPGADGDVPVASATLPGLVDEDLSLAYACRGMGDGASGFVVVCRVNGPAAATSVGTKDPTEGVWSQAGDSTLVRFDLPMETDGADAKVIGLEKAGRGVLLRVEASRVPGEKEALLAIGSDAREQPHPVRRGCVCRLPIDPLL